ncbi:MAG: ComF family protein [Desulfatibacillum sp.]|nr:ComF family protein [Desulfatibacillum sp.]
MFIQAAKIWKNAILDALYPGKCAACGDIIPKALPSPTLPFLCPDCCEDFEPVASPLCLQCGMPFVSPEGPDHVCGGCLEKKNRFGRARAAGVYDGPLRTSIHRLKYNRKTSLAKPMGKMLEQAYLDHFGPGGADIAVPVPLHAKRLRQRGFNQSLVLVRNWRNGNGTLPPVADCVLSRVRMTRSQAGLKARERARNIRGAFSVTQPELIRDKRVLLIDDVFTTGATANECAKVLLKAGAENVDVLTLAVVVR